MNNDETKRLDEILDEQLELTDLEQLKGGVGTASNEYLQVSKDQDAGHGTSNCCNSGW